MGAIPNKLPGFQDIENDAEACARFERGVGRPGHAEVRLEPDADVRGDGARRADRAVRDRREPGSLGGRRGHARKLLGDLDSLIVQDMFMTKTAEMADVVLPAANSAFESEGTVTNSERRVQRVRKALEPPGDARDDIWIIAQLAKRLGRDWGEVTPRSAWDELRALSPMHAGMTCERLEALGGIQWPCSDEEHPGDAVPARPAVGGGAGEARAKAPFSVVVRDPPVDELTEEFPLRLTTGRRLDSYNTGVQTGGYTSPLRRGETIDMSPEDADGSASRGVRSSA